MDHVGQSPARPDGIAKVSGTARFTDDLPWDGLHGATLRSPHPHARVASLRWNPERAPAGSVRVLAGDIPGANGVQLLDDGWPVLADGIVRHVGEPVALVAAPTRGAARAALAAFDVAYEPLAPVLTWEEAQAAPPFDRLALNHGDVEKGMAGSDLVVEGTYRTGHQEHIYIECQAMQASFDGDGVLHLEGSMQCPFYVLKALIHSLGLSEEKVRVRPAAVGGGFGGKEDYPSLLAIHAALLAKASGRPVRMVYDRHEDIVSTTKRHPSLIRHRTGVRRDGRIVAMEIDVLLDGGAYRTLSPVVLSRAVLHATGPYRCHNVRVVGKVLRTNTATNGAFRGFGAPQVQFASERQMDRIARRLGLDPYEIRARNVLEPGDALATGQILDGTASARLCLERAAAKSDFRRTWRRCERARDSRRDDGEPMRGVGLSLYFHGAGFTGMGEKHMRSPATARLMADGRIEILTATTEMGQGSAVVLPMIAAEAAGVTLDDVVLAHPDTSAVPDSGPTVASRTTMVVGGTVARAVSELKRRLTEWLARDEGLAGKPDVRDGQVAAAPAPGGSGEPLGSFREIARKYLLAVGPLSVTIRHAPASWQVFDDATYRGAAYAAYGWGADVMEVEVDPDTLEVRTLKATVVCEVGRAIHPTLCRGQVEGGTLQAVGYALMEEVKTAGGRYLNDRMSTYIIPTIIDSPKMDVELLERPWEGGAFGAKGVGELPMDGGAPAVIQAVENATGLSPEEIPCTPEKLFECRRREIGAGPSAEAR
jgi:CO/xanthine dehydrogenase Mo-binding subunit